MKTSVSLLAVVLAAWPAAAYDNISLAGTASFKKAVADPGGVAAGGDGTVYVSDVSGGVVRVFGADGKPKGVVGAKGKGAGQLGAPRGVALGAGGALYVADADLNRVTVYDKDGKFVRSIGVKGPGAGQLSGPQGVAASWDGVLYVADTGNDRVQVFSEDGVYLFSFGGPGEGAGQFKKPSAVALSPDGRIFVMDQKRVQSFTADGKSPAVLDRPKEAKEKEAPAPTGLAADPHGYLYVANERQKVEEYGRDGKFVAAFGTSGTGAGQFKDVSGLAASASGAVAALDVKLGRVQLFKPVSEDKTAPLVPGPTLRFSVRALETVPFVVDDLAFLGDTAVGVVTKTSQVLAAGRRGADKPRVWGGKGKTLGQVNAPTGVFTTEKGLFVVDAGNQRILPWNAEGKPAGEAAIGGGGKREGQFKEPRACAVDAAGKLYVADPALARVQVFSQDGIPLAALAGAFQEPVDVAATQRGVAVLDAGKKSLFFFDEKGKAAGVAAGFTSPVAAASRGAAGPNDFVMVLDAGTSQVKVVGKGGVVASFGSPALFQNPRTLAVDDRGVLWVGDAQGLKSFQVRMVPLPPASFKAKAGEGQVELSWQKDPENLAEGFRLFRSTTGAGGTVFQALASTETVFIDREIVPGLAYTYGVAAVAGGVAGARATASVKTERPANLPPVEINEIALDNVFSSQYKFYEKNPVGRVVVKNNTEKTFQKIRVGFTVQNYMDFVTEKVIDRFEPGARETLDLKATFNNKILSVTEDTPLQAQLTVTYYDNGEEKVFKRAEPFTLYSRNAITWDDPARLATFITAKDPALLEWAREAVRSFGGEIEASPVNPAIAKAAVIFEALGVQGLSYAKDPSNPFEKVSENAKAVDYVQYPRETLKRKSGDCDDLTALIAAALEAVSVPTAVVDAPGHVLLLFQVDESAPLDPGLAPGDAVMREGSAWIPLETTKVGKTFAEAWAEGAKLFRNTPEDRIRVVESRDAWAVYAPATLSEEAVGAIPPKAEVSAKFPDGLKPLEEKRLGALTARWQAAMEASPQDPVAPLQVGLAYADHGRLEDAAQWFDKALAVDAGNAAALNNRANLHMIKGEAAPAKALYEKAAAADVKDAGVRVNLARAALALKDRAAAQKALAEAQGLDPELKKTYSTLEELGK